jgi:hypothetical protein
MRSSEEWVVIETSPSEESRVEYGSGPMVREPQGGKSACTEVLKVQCMRPWEEFGNESLVRPPFAYRCGSREMNASPWNALDWSTALHWNPAPD